MKQQQLELQVKELLAHAERLEQALKDERSGAAWRKANGNHSIERQQTNGGQ